MAISLDQIERNPKIGNKAYPEQELPALPEEAHENKHVELKPWEDLLDKILERKEESYKKDRVLRPWENFHKELDQHKTSKESSVMCPFDESHLEEQIRRRAKELFFGVRKEL